MVLPHGNDHKNVIIPRTAPNERGVQRGQEVYFHGFQKCVEAGMHNALKSTFVPNSTTMWVLFTNYITDTNYPFTQNVFPRFSSNLIVL